MDDGSSGYYVSLNIDDSDDISPLPQNFNHKRGQNNPKSRKRGRSPVQFDISEDEMSLESLGDQTWKVASKSKVCHYSSTMLFTHELFSSVDEQKLF